MGRGAPSEVVPADFSALSTVRAARANHLAALDPATCEQLLFYGAVASFQGRVPPEEPLNARRELVELVLRSGTTSLKAEVRWLDEQVCQDALDDVTAGRDTESPRSFFARVLLGPATTEAAGFTPSPAAQDDGLEVCPRCGHPPQVGCLRPEGHGTALSLICSLCLTEWVSSRERCPACSQASEHQTSWFSAQNRLPHVHVRACDLCHHYLQVVDLDAEPLAVPDVDEVAALALDLWAREKGYRKIRPNLVGI